MKTLYVINTVSGLQLQTASLDENTCWTKWYEYTDDWDETAYNLEEAECLVFKQIN